MKKLFVLLVLLAVGGAGYYIYTRPAVALVLTGIVTTNDVVVSPQISGQIGQLLVAEGDLSRRINGSRSSRPTSSEPSARMPHKTPTRCVAGQGKPGGVAFPADADRRANPSGRIDPVSRPVAGDGGGRRCGKRAAHVFAGPRTWPNRRSAAQELDLARTTNNSAKAKLDSLKQQVEAARAAVALARANAEQVAMRRSQVTTTERQQAAADAQRAKADVRLTYTQLKAPIDASSTRSPCGPAKSSIPGSRS